jgi:hypothetical protein
MKHHNFSLEETIQRQREQGQNDKKKWSTKHNAEN